MKILTLALLLAVSCFADWITPKGKTYHPKRTCIALRTTQEPQEITEADAKAKGLRACGICNRKAVKK